MTRADPPIAAGSSSPARPPMVLAVPAAAVFAAVCVGPAAALLIHLIARIGDPAVAEAAAVLTAPDCAAALLRSVRVVGAATVVCVLLGVPYAFLLARTPLPLRATWERLTFLGLLIPAYFPTVAWIALLGFEGTITRLLGLADGATAPVCTEPGMVLVLVGGLLPVVVLLTAPALRRVRGDLEDAARLEMPALAVALRVTIPAAAPEIAAAAVLAFALGIGGWTATDLLPADRLYASWLFAGYREFAYSAAAVTVLMLPLLAVVPAGMAAAAWLVRSGAGGGQLGAAPPADFALSAAGRAAASAYVAAVWGVAVGVPAAAVLVRIVPPDGGPAEALSVLLAAVRTGLPALLDSLWSAGAAAVIGAGVAVVLAGAASGPRGRRLLPMVLAPAVLPAALAGTALMFLRTELPALGPLLGRDLTVRFDDGSAWVLRTGGLVLPLAFLGRFLPFAVVIAAAGFARLDSRLWEAAAADGATPWQTWRRVVLPILAPYAAAAGLLIFALSMGEVETVNQIVPPNRQLLAARIYEQAHRSLEHDLAATCALLLGVIGAAATGLHALLRDRRPSSLR